jgi:RNA polymerase sigma-70 factor, ECF subfamily
MHRVSSSEEIDRYLLDRVGRGDREAFERFYSHTVDHVRRMLRGSFGLREDLADVVQEVFLQVWLRAASYDPERGAPIAWLMVLARSRALDLLRKTPRQPVPVCDAPEQADTAVDPAETLWLERELEQLPAPLRCTVRLSFYEGFSHSQIARKLGRPLGTVKTNLRVCVQQIRARAMAKAAVPCQRCAV